MSRPNVANLKPTTEKQMNICKNNGRNAYQSIPVLTAINWVADYLLISSGVGI